MEAKNRNYILLLPVNKKTVFSCVETKKEQTMAEPTQYTDYYPFGLAHTTHTPGFTPTSTNRYLYNGKLLQHDGFDTNSDGQPDYQLNLYDYGARFYDPAVGRWHSVDPMAKDYDSYSPYNYVLNNPINAIDPDGMDVKIVKGTNSENGRKTVHFIVTMSVRNNSRLSNQVVSERAVAVASQIEQSYSGYDKATNTEYSTSVKFNKDEKNYVLEFTHDVSSANPIAAGTTKTLGDTKNNVMEVGLDQGIDGNPLQTKSETTRTGAHEFGHTLSLEHGPVEGRPHPLDKGKVLKSNTEPNLMNTAQYTNSTYINTEQLKKAQKQVEKDENKN